MSKSNKVTSIKEALNFLNSTAHEKAEDIQSAIESNYSEFKNVVGKLKPTIKNRASTITEQAFDLKDDLSETAYEVRKKIERNTKKSPLKAIGIVSLGAFILGYLSNSNKK